MASTNPVQRKQSQKPLLSQSTILILSGYLVGASAALKVEPVLQLCIHASGMIGLIMYLGLIHLEHRRRKREMKHRKQSLSRLEVRFDRHVPRFRPRRKVNRIPTNHDMYRQYLPVTQANRPLRKTDRIDSFR